MLTGRQRNDNRANAQDSTVPRSPKAPRDESLFGAACSLTPDCLYFFSATAESGLAARAGGTIFVSFPPLLLVRLRA